MVERFIFFQIWMVEIPRSQKNNYNFDKMTVVEIQEGSKYWSNYGSSKMAGSLTNIWHMT